MAYTANRPTRETIDLVSRLRGRWHRDYAMCHCPAHEDRTPSLSIRQGDKGVLVHCFAGCAPAQILRALPLAFPTEVSPRTGRPFDTASAAVRLWQESIPVRGTLAEIYLRRRALPVGLPDLRYHPACPRRSCRPEPALIAAVRQGGVVTGIQRTFLRTDGRWHTGKLSLGRITGGAWQGARPGTQLAIAEGVEDAAAFQKWMGVASWASCGSANAANIVLPADVSILWVPYDLGAAGRRMVGALGVRHSHRLEVRPVSPAPCADWAEKGKWLEGRGMKEASNEGASDDQHPGTNL